MKSRLARRGLSWMLVLVMLLGLLPVTAVGEAEALCLSAASSVSHLYVGEGPARVSAAFSGGAAPYTVTLEAVREGAVVFSESCATTENAADFAFTPDCYGDYQLVVRVCDGQGTQQLTTMALYAAEHEQESWADWESSVSGANLSGGWGQRLLSVARTQLGYAQSERDFILKGGQKRHYSRYGAWFGLPYGGWNNAFLAFAAHYANLPADALPGADCSSWIAGMRRKTAYMEQGSGYVPAAGDVAFLGGGRAAVIESTDGVNVTVIEGDVNGSVARRSYALSRLAGVGNMGLLMGLHNGTATAVPEDSASLPPSTPEPTAPPPSGEEELVFRATPTPPPGRTAAPRDDADPLASAAGAIADKADALNAAATGVPQQFSEAYELAREGMRALAARYLRKGESTAEEIAAFVQNLSRGEVYYILTDMEDLAVRLGEAGLTDYEANALTETEFAYTQLERALLTQWAQMSMDKADPVVYTPVADAPGLTVTVQLKPAAGTNALATTTPTANGLGVELRGGKRALSGYNYAAATLTVSNGTEEDVILSFVWQATDVYALTIDGSDSVLCENPFQRKLTAGDSFTIEMKTGQNATTNTLHLSGFSLGAQAAVPKITVQYDAAQGQVVTADGALASGASVDAVVSYVEAVPAEGMRFVAWVDAGTQKLLSQEARYVPPMAEKATIQAVFAAENGDSPALFLADGTLYSDLNAACQAEDATIILISGGALSAGNHTVSQGKTLLIPFDAAHTDPGGKPNIIAGAHSGTASAFCTLKIPADAVLTVEGALTVGGSQNMDSAPVSGCLEGPYGHIDMAGQIILPEGGVLQAWGVISGTGEVTAQRGATVREAFQLRDWRGAAFPQMVGRTERVYPFSQYRVQNIEAPLRLLAGAQSEAWLAVSLPTSGVGVFAVQEPVPLVGGEGSLFALTSGSITRTLDSGRMHFTLNGTAAMASFTLNIASSDLNAAAYDLPINSGTTIEAASGTLAIRQDLLLQPGAELIIREGASCALGEGRRIIVCDSADWGDFILGGAAASGDATLLIDGELTAEGASGCLYTTAGGANLVSGGTGKIRLTIGAETAHYQAVQSGAEIAYTKVAIINARLRNADGSFTPLDQPGIYPIENGQPGAALAYEAGASVCYEFINGKWTIPCTEAIHYGHLIEGSAPTCTECGSLTLACACDFAAPQTFDIPANDHRWQEAACTEPRTCTVCGETEATALGHAWEALGDPIPATCEAEGSWPQRCTRCQTIDTQTTPALGHMPVTDAAADATCTASGLTEGAHCGRCGKILAAQQEIAALGHSYLSTETAPSCTADGYTTHLCARCGDRYTDSLIPARHAWTGTGAIVTEPSCTTPGLRASDACSACGATQDEVEIPALGHSYMADGAPVESLGQIIQTAACERPVIREYACTREGCGFSEQITGDPLGHDLTQHEGRAPTCTEAGWAAYAVCKREGCGYTTHAPLAATGHTETQIPAVAASCTAPGSTAGTKCAVCGLILTEAQAVSAAGHRFPAGQEGADCIARSCTVCRERIEAAAEHDYAAVTTLPTCITPGFTTHTCARCGESYTDAPTDAKGHTLDEGRVTQEATCTLPGEMTYACQNDGCSYMRTDILPAAHDVVTDPGTPATCDADGLSEGRHCSRCGEVLLAQTVLPKGHVWSAPPCTDPAAACQRCGLTHTGVLPHDLPEVSCTAPQSCRYGCGHTVASPGHDKAVIDAIPALCASDGWTSGWACARCGEGDAPKRIPALGHNILQHEARKATYTGAGWAAYEACTRCEYTTRVEIPALGVQPIGSYGELLAALPWLETWAADYAPAEAPSLVIGYLAGTAEEFARHVHAREHEENQQRTELINVSGLQGLTTLQLPNGETADMAALFILLNAAVSSGFAPDETDAAGWAGILAQLLIAADHTALIDEANGDGEKLADLIRENLLSGYETALRTAMDGCLLLQSLASATWQPGDLAALFTAYFTETLSDAARAEVMLSQRFGGPATRSAARDAVLGAYAANPAVAAIEAAHIFQTTDPTALRRAVCHAFADFLCDQAGGYAEADSTLTITSSDFAELAPGISLESYRAVTGEGKQVVYQLAFADAGRSDVSVLANYASRAPEGWQAATVQAQAEAAQALYGSAFWVMAAINGGSFASGGAPTGLLVMDGKVYHDIDGGGFFGVTQEGHPVIGTMQEYNVNYRNRLAEGVGGCGALLINDGAITFTAADTARDSRSAVGITSGGRVVFLALDGAQEPWSCGATLLEIAQILLNAGCTRAICLDGGGSTTLVTRKEAGLRVVNRPSQGAARSVGASLIMVSTASTGETFDHAVIESEKTSVKVGATLQLTALGLTASGAEIALPEGTAWAVSDESIGSISTGGLFTAKTAGMVEVRLLLGETILASKTLQVVAAATVSGPVLTWQRSVRNAVGEGTTYYAADPTQAMVTAYGLTLDLRQLPIPERMGGLMTLLPDLAVEAATTWDFLLQQAERISGLTQIQAALVFDPGMQVDASGLSVSSDCFTLGSADFDAAANTLTLTLSWIPRTAPVASADPLCRITGIQLVPKETAWDASERFTPVNQASVGYAVYMRASGLYTFAQDAANQAAYGLSPYDEAGEQGAYFEASLDQPSDSYTLARAAKNGWVGEDGGFRYYVEGAYLTGLAQAEGLYYDFGADGLHPNRQPCTGLYTLNGAACYLNEGRLTTGWQMVEGHWYCFDEAGRGITGSVAGEVPGVTFALENGRLRQGCWLADASGRRYYNGPEQYLSGWKTIDGETYYFENGYARTGVGPLKEEGVSPDRWHEFTPEGAYVGKAPDGLYWHGGELYHITSGIPQSTGLYLIDGYYYNFTYEHIAVRSQSYWVYQPNGLDMPRAMYRFDDEGKMILTSEIVDEGGVLYYYENGPRAEQKGLIQLNGYFYYIGAGGVASANGAFLVEETNGLIDPPGVYRFDEKGRMLLDTAIVPNVDGALQYFHEGCLTVAAGLVLVDGGYYYIQGDGTAVTNTSLWVHTTNGYVEPGEYTFGPDGRMLPRDKLNGIHDGCYYVNDVPTHAGLLKIGENYYYAGPGGKIVTGQQFEIILTNGLLPAGVYEFDENGRILLHEGLVAREGKLYYYESGRLAKAKGLIEHRAAYYYIGEDGAALTDVRMQVEATNGLLPPGEYCFGEDGVLFVRLPGDANATGTVDETDAVLLLRRLTGENTPFNRFNADANDDGALNEHDVLLILQYAAGWDVTLK